MSDEVSFHKNVISSYRAVLSRLGMDVDIKKFLYNLRGRGYDSKILCNLKSFSEYLDKLDSSIIDHVKHILTGVKITDVDDINYVQNFINNIFRYKELISKSEIMEILAAELNYSNISVFRRVAHNLDGFIRENVYISKYIKSINQKLKLKGKAEISLRCLQIKNIDENRNIENFLAERKRALARLDELTTLYLMLASDYYPLKDVFMKIDKILNSIKECDYELFNIGKLDNIYDEAKDKMRERFENIIRNLKQLKESYCELSNKFDLKVNCNFIENNINEIYNLQNAYSQMRKSLDELYIYLLKVEKIKCQIIEYIINNFSIKSISISSDGKKKGSELIKYIDMFGKFIDSLIYLANSEIVLSIRSLQITTADVFYHAMRQKSEKIKEVERKLNENKPDEAIAVLNEIMKESPNDAYYYYYAKAYIQKGMYEEALKMCEKASSAIPRYEYYECWAEIVKKQNTNG
ncbi:tetratricopeptide repeat protein [Sulfurisphaera javensis]